MRVTRHQAVQVHDVPSQAMAPRGPFPAEWLKEPEMVLDYEPQFPEDGADFAPGSTAQNNYRPPKYLRCKACLARVLETETASHVCEE